jgi:hypothetical protein
MKKATKGWLITAVSLVLVGAVLFAVVMTALHWDFNRLSTRRYETTTHAITESFTHISVTADTADIQFAPSEDDSVSVVCYEDIDFTHTVAVEGDTLVIQPTQSPKWYHYVGIGFASPTITVYLPEGKYGDLTLRASTASVEIGIYFTFDNMDVKVSTGDVTSFSSVTGAAKIRTTTGCIYIKSLNAGSLDLSVSTGDVQMKNINTGALNIQVTTGKTTAYRVRCSHLTSDGSTGDLFLRDVIAKDYFTITRSTGDVTMEECDAGSMKITTDTGDVLGTLLTQKVFVTHTDTGHVRLPHTAPSGGPCEITTDTGNIHITLV